MSEFHATASPSKLPRILNCMGSLLAVQELEKDEESKEMQSTFAAEGTMLHAIMNDTILRSIAEKSPEFILYPELTSECDVEQITALQDSVDYANTILATISPTWRLIKVEERVYLEEFHKVLKNTNGQADLVIIDLQSNILHVLDWKFGAGVQVYVEDNDQAYAYAAGATLIPAKANVWPDMVFTSPEAYVNMYTEIKVHIVQPRLDHYDMIVLKPHQLLDWIYERAIPRLLIAFQPNAPLTPGYKQCMWCPMVVCTARMAEANATAARVFAIEDKMKPTRYGEVSAEEVGAFLTLARRLKDTISAMEDFLAIQVRSGQDVPGWKMVEGRSIRRWADPAAAEEYLMNREDIDFEDIYKTEMKTPAQIEKLSKEMKNSAEFNALIIKPQGKPSLVTNMDKRPAIEFRTAEQLFGDYLVKEED